MAEGANITAPAPSTRVLVDHITEPDARVAYEALDLELERLVFIERSPNPLAILLAECERDRAEARWEAVASQVPERTPFAETPRPVPPLACTIAGEAV